MITITVTITENVYSITINYNCNRNNQICSHAILCSTQVLGDIEVALSMQKDKDKGHSDLETVPHPHDVNYGLLKTDLELVEPSSELYKVSYCNGSLEF